YWTDSVALWSRAVELDPRNDIALYNLATAFSEAGRRQDAIAMYQRVLAGVPQQEDAKRNLVALKAADLEQRGNQLATEGRLLEAADQYAAALALDPKRVPAQAGRGMALLQAGHVAASITPLREAVRLGADDPAVPAALGAVLSDVG